MCTIETGFAFSVTKSLVNERVLCYNELPLVGPLSGRREPSIKVCVAQPPLATWSQRFFFSRRWPLTIVQWCPSCRKMVTASLVEEHKSGYRVAEFSSCLICERVLWSWKQNFGPPIDPAVKDEYVQGKLF